jgi:pilus assembly protein Flp/PilA
MHKHKLLQNQKGQSLVEYLIIVAIVGIGSIAITRSMGQVITVKMATVVEKLGGKIDGDLSQVKVSKSAYKKKDFTSFMDGADANGSGGKSNDSQD